MNFHPSYPILLLFELGNKTVPAHLVFVQYKKEDLATQNANFVAQVIA